MIASTRRRFLAQSASLLSLGASALGGGAALAAMGPNDKFDLLVKGGEVVDPSQNLRGRLSSASVGASSRRWSPTFPRNGRFRSSMSPASW